ncbi:Eukaryotic translation initiation factor 1A [Linum perenne]
MPKNKGKGGKNKKRGKNETDQHEKRDLLYKEDEQEYAKVVRMLGNNRVEAKCVDGVTRLCHIRGTMQKKVWISTNDIVLVGLRGYEDSKADIIWKYLPDEARLLKAYGELPSNMAVNQEDDEDEINDNVEFVAEDIDRI